MNIIKRFWKYVNKRGPDECWLWTGATGSKGHGRFWIKYKQQAAHRISWAIAHRIWPIPKDKQINHTCDNRSCVNPAHLYLGTQEENNQDTSPLTVKDVREIRYLHNIEGYSHNQLGYKFNVKKQCIGNICRYETWKNV